jgi:hypothetical protein
MRKPNSFTTERHIKVGYEGNGMLHHKFFEKDYVTIETDDAENYVGEIEKIKVCSVIIRLSKTSDIETARLATNGLFSIPLSNVVGISKARRVRNA